ncbi:hypothetical protein GPECTOR_42g743 [Gonium pectorale]|uniref:Ankyrin repeat domain-containing protein n=1 Tax=Gonium pectorale TaxID=33097 RepID=A0A150G9K8_GONPE|nr:hypothetical protein GPECTOR_42g743 [Gonium pectorale]|eukprot:KXZ46536.1 hypothetical protein GPECTOR_42g743 [Gonium pectorale]
MAALQFLVGEAGVSVSESERDLIARKVCIDGDLEALQALHAAGWELRDPSFYAFMAARRGHLHVLTWLHETLGAEAVEIDAVLLSAAAYSGSVEAMAWLRERGCEWGCSCISNAAGSGCEEAVEWLVAQGCRIEAYGYAYTAACRKGDLAMARLLRRLGVPWGPAGEVVLQALRDSPLPMLRWLLEAGCPVGDYEAARTAVAERPSGREEALELLEAHRQRRRGAEGGPVPKLLTGFAVAIGVWLTPLAVRWCHRQLSGAPANSNYVCGSMDS